MGSSTTLSFAGRVALVAGGGGGIGRATALELARRGAAVVVMDPGVGVEGEPLDEPTAAETATMIEAAGGTARASTASVADADAVRGLFSDTVAELGSLDIVVNAAGVLRFAPFADSTEDDWRTVLAVHLDGYLHLLSAALPLMEDAGYGRIVGFTSGVGNYRTAVQGPAYGAAKRAVAALTRHIGAAAPPGVSVNALSPIAATRMVRDVLIASGEEPRGLDLSGMPQPEDMAPAAALLAGEELGWCRGEVVFSAGTELSLVAPPTIVEAFASDAADLPSALDALFPVVLGPAESLQATSGGTNPRVGPVFTQAATFAPSDDHPGGCLVVSGDPGIGGALADAVGRWARPVVGLGPAHPFAPSAGRVPTTFAGAVSALSRAEGASGPIGAVMVFVDADEAVVSEPGWYGLLDAHRAVTPAVMAHAAWSRAAARHAVATGRAVRVVHVVAARSPAGRTAAEAVAQMVRWLNDTPLAVPVDAFAVSLEGAAPSDRAPLGHLCARLAFGADAKGLAGAELAVASRWVGLRRHPSPVATVSFGGPAIPDWVAHCLHQVSGTGAPN